MPNHIDWTSLRAKLIAQFSEDVVQQTLLAMLEKQAQGVVILNPLHWCRKWAAGYTKMERRATKARLAILPTPRERHADGEQLRRLEAREELASLDAGAALDTPMSPSRPDPTAAARKRRSRKRRREEAA